MSKQDVINYVMHTPYNANESVLRSLLENLDNDGDIDGLEIIEAIALEITSEEGEVYIVIDSFEPENDYGIFKLNYDDESTDTGYFFIDEYNSYVILKNGLFLAEPRLSSDNYELSLIDLSEISPPAGTLEITSDGEYDVKDYAFVDVDILNAQFSSTFEIINDQSSNESLHITYPYIDNNGQIIYGTETIYSKKTKIVKIIPGIPFMISVVRHFTIELLESQNISYYTYFDSVQNTENFIVIPYENSSVTFKVASV